MLVTTGINVHLNVQIKNQKGHTNIFFNLLFTVLYDIETNANPRKQQTVEEKSQTV